jgi:hypothetical protein
MVKKAVKSMSHQAGIIIYRSIEFLGGEGNFRRIIPYGFGLKVKLFCLQRLID